MDLGSLPVIHRLPCVTSTQHVARDAIELGVARAGHIVLADEQTDGVGRRGRTWASPRGGFYASFVVPRDPLIAVRAGVAVARALEASSIPVQLKWPNDLCVLERKLGGILIETVEELALVGVGINLAANPLPEAACLRDLKASVNPEEFARAVYAELTHEEVPKSILDAYRARLATLGRRVRVDLGTRDVVGRSLDVDAAGNLVVETDAGLVTVAAGDCVHLREARAGSPTPDAA